MTTSTERSPDALNAYPKPPAAILENLAISSYP